MGLYIGCENFLEEPVQFYIKRLINKWLDSYIDNIKNLCANV